MSVADKHDSFTERDRLIRVEDAASLLSVSAATVRRWCAQGLLQGITLPHGVLRVRASSVRALARGQR